MLELLAKIIDWLKSPKRWAAILITGMVLLLIPKWFPEAGEAPWKIYRPWIILTVILSGSVLGVEAISTVVKYAQGRWRRRNQRRIALGYLKNLTPPEKSVLAQYMQEETETQYLSSVDGVVSGLVSKSLLYRSSNIGQHSWGGPIFAYNLQPWARHYILKNPEVLAKPKQQKPPSYRNLLGL